MRFSKYVIFGFSSVAIAMWSVSCAVDRPESRPRERMMHEWHDDGGPGKISVCISLPDQIAEFERGGRPIGWSYVATGKEGHATPPGTFSICEKVLDKYSDTYGWMEDDFGNIVNPDAKSSDRVPRGLHYVPAPMPNWMRITLRGVGMHGGVIPEPGRTASHGCIRLPKDFAPILYDAVELGTQVIITRKSFRYSLAHRSPQASDSTDAF